MPLINLTGEQWGHLCHQAFLENLKMIGRLSLGEISRQSYQLYSEVYKKIYDARTQVLNNSNAYCAVDITAAEFVFVIDWALGHRTDCEGYLYIWKKDKERGEKHVRSERGQELEQQRDEAIEMCHYLTNILNKQPCIQLQPETYVSPFTGKRT